MFLKNLSAFSFMKKSISCHSIGLPVSNPRGHVVTNFKLRRRRRTDRRQTLT